MAAPVAQLTHREIDILEALARYRGLTAEQVSTLFFPPTETRNKDGVVVMAERDPAKTRISKAAWAKLKKLVQDKLIFRHPLYRGGPAIYALDTKGAKELSQLREVPADLLRVSRHSHTELAISPTYALHLVKSNDIRIAIELAAADHGFTIPTWTDEKMLRATHREDRVQFMYNEGVIETTVIPDGYFVIDSGTRPFSHFLEIDLRTETVKTTSTKGKDFGRKIAAYLAYFGRLGSTLSPYERRYGTAKGRVLTITTGEQRLENLKRITEDVGGKERFWFTTFSRIETGDILTSRIWDVASLPDIKPLIF